MLNQFRATNIVWDRASLKLYAAIRASSSDENGRKLVVQVINKGVTENLENTSLSLYWETQDGENRGLDPFEPLDPENGIYELYFRTGMLKHVGKLNAHLHLVDTTGAITSEPFTIFVFEGVDVDAMASDDELSALNKALIEVQNITQDETERVSSENERKTAETIRLTNETDRVDNEEDRVVAESNRASAESSRIVNENARLSAESDRVSAENVRAEGYPLLDGRLTTVEQNIDAHVADYASLFTTNADAKNSIYRGKYLGNTVTAEQYVTISSGTFTDLYIGDYWTIGGINWRIAAFNYYRNTGDSFVPGNHITIVPETQLYNHVMNDTNITTGGYIGSKMHIEGLEQAKTTIRGIFGTHLVKHRQIYSNAVTDGKASDWAWIDSEVDLMSEIMVYGSVIWGESTIGGSGYNIGIGKSQLPLFTLNPRMINMRQTYWLRDVVAASYFAYVSNNGNASCNDASNAYGVRPAFSIS